MTFPRKLINHRSTWNKRRGGFVCLNRAFESVEHYYLFPDGDAFMKKKVAFFFKLFATDFQIFFPLAYLLFQEVRTGTRVFKIDS
jgi:hypothetical protein